jgi:hypothetical protein
VPGLAEVKLHRGAENKLQQVGEVRCHRGVGQIVALALHDVARELGRRVRGAVVWEEADVTDEQAADHRVLADPDRGAPVPADPRPHLLHAGDPVSLAEELPGLGDPKPRKVAEEASADKPVVRVVGLEEERLARGQDGIRAAPAGTQRRAPGRQRHPGVVIGAGQGGRQAWIPEPNGEIVTSPYTLRALLGKLDGLNVAARTRDHECGCG